MGEHSSVVVTIDGTGDPRSIAHIITMFRHQIWPATPDGARADPADLAAWGTPTAGYQVTGELVSWGVYLDFPAMVVTALTDHHNADGHPDPLPLVAFDWTQTGFGDSTPDWQLRARPTPEGTYDTHEVSLVMGDRYLTEHAARHIAQSHPNPAEAVAAFLHAFDGPPALTR